jgi:hypothetical protein
MKMIFTLSLFLLSSVLKAETDTSFIGIWKIVSIEMDGIYLKFENDSISLSDELKAKYTDDAKKKQLAGTIRMMWSATKFQFEKNGNLKLTLMGETENMPYRINSSKNEIELTSKNSLNEEVIDKIKYTYINGLLQLAMKWGEDDEEFIFVLEKE